MGPLNSRDAVQALPRRRSRRPRPAAARSRPAAAAIDRAGNFVLPTIVTGLTNDAEVVQTETFAPILYVMKFKPARRGASTLQNAVPQGLSSSIFTTNLQGGRSVPGRGRFGLRHRQRQHRHQRRGDRRRVRRREGNRRRPRVRLRRVEAYMRRQTNTINYSDALPLAQGIKFDL